MDKEKVKEKVKQKIVKDKKPIYLSAQDYKLMTDDEKITIGEVLTEEGIDAIEYDKKMRKLWPRTVVLNTKWRDKWR